MQKLCLYSICNAILGLHTFSLKKLAFYYQIKIEVTEAL
jgi:hypothetical protein